MTSSVAPIRLGTRQSLLARWQADWVASQLRVHGAEVILVPMVTLGDRQSEVPPGASGDRGVFTKEIQRALVDREVDLAVHSLKDLPTDPVPGLCLSAVSERASVADALVSAHYSSLDTLPRGASVGTGSPRRRAQLLYARGDLVMKDIRGNVNTRLRKLDAGDYEALVLAEAGLERLGLAGRIAQSLPPEVSLPAVGQGALGLETRCDDARVRQIVEHLDHPETRAAVVAERAMLATLGGGCLSPVAAWGRVESGRLVLTGRVLSLDGSEKVGATLSAVLVEAELLGRRVAETLDAQGAQRLIDAARSAGR